MQNINVNIVPDNFPQTIRYSQGDIGRQFKINVTDFDIPVGATVKIQATKPSGFGFSVAGVVAGSSVTFTTTAEMTDEAGRFQAELQITAGDDVIGTANFLMIGERNPHPEGTTDGSQGTIIPELTLLVERVEKAASDVLDMEVVATTLPAGSQATYSYDEALNKATFGIPEGQAGAGAAGVVASAYSAAKTYKVGDYVLYNSNLYRCTTAITTAEAWTAAHWTQVVLADDVTDLKSDLGLETNLVSDGYYTMINTGKDLNYLGQLTDNSGVDTSDYIDVHSVYDICRVVPNTTKYGMSSICYYAADYTFIRRDLPGTSYDFDTFNDETVVWFNLDKTTANIKYVRFNTEISRNFKYRLVYENVELHKVEEIAEDAVSGVKTVLDYEIAPETPTSYYTLTNTGKDLNYLGQLTDNSGVDSSDYIDIDNLYDVCRVVSNKTKYGMCNICYYDSVKNFIRRDNAGTSYDFSIYNGENVVWFDVDKQTAGIKYIRFSSENNRGFKYWVVENAPKAAVLDDYAKIPFIGKTIVNFGDSIFGQTRPPKDVSSYLAEKTGATVYNCGFGGCEMSVHSDSNYDAFSMYRLADAVATNTWTLQETAAAASGMPAYFAETVALLKTIDFSKVDIVTIGYGTNDWNNGTELDNGGDSNKAYFADALRYSIETLLTAFPNLKIFVCTQTYRFFMDGSYNFVDDSNTHTNSHGKTLIDFVNKTIEVAEQYNLPYINNYYIGMGKYSRSYYFYTTDGTHPKPEGNMLIAANMANKLF